jgi:glutamate/tyrosine decarboxylase-like PLP-dependent enzyme
MINDTFKDWSPAEIIGLMLFLQYGYRTASFTYSAYRNWDTRDIMDTFANETIKIALQTPLKDRVEKEIKKEVTKNLVGYKKSIDADRAGMVFRRLPEKGLPLEEIIQLYPDDPIQKPKGRASGGIYTEYPPELLKAMEQIFTKVILTNQMHPMFKDLKKKEAEVLSMIKNIFNGPLGAHAILTYGGSFSIFEGLKSYILHARNIKGIEKPEIILPHSAHPAFKKAIEALNGVPVFVPLDPEGTETAGQASLAKIKAAITSKTCLIVGSAPSFPHGVFDDIEKMAEIGRTNKNYLFQKDPIPVLVDQCLGGFFTPFAEKIGIKMPIVDFRIKGVECIVADPHKYGYTDKGVSCVIFRNDPLRLLRQGPTNTQLVSPVGSYVTPGLAGSRTGRQIAAAHTALLYYGEDGYILRAKEIHELTTLLKKRIQKEIPDIVIPYKTEFPVIGMKTKSPINPLVVIEVMKNGYMHKANNDNIEIYFGVPENETPENSVKGDWELNTLLTHDLEPGFHFCVTALHTIVPHFADDFIDFLKASVKFVGEHPNIEPKGVAKAYGLLKTGAVPTLVQNLIGQGYVEIDQSLPGDTISSIDESLLPRPKMS